MTAARPSGRLTGRVSGSYPLADTYHLEALTREMRVLTGEVSGVVMAATGLDLGGRPDTVVIGREEWVDRNVAAFGHMLEPARRRVEERLEESGRLSPSTSAAMRRMMDAEMRLVLGVLSRRVLGQYELVLPGGDEGDTVAYVAANILQLERRHQFRPSEFRYWVALHELTHRAQFRGVPWLRGYFMGLVEELVDQTQPEPGRLARIAQDVASRWARGDAIIDDRGLLGLFATPEQSEVMGRVQALMTVLEGHGHVVMDRVGAENLKSQARMSRVLKARRLDRRTAAFFRLTGLEMKMKQYQMGERFIKHVEREAGWSAVSLLYRGAGSLPTLAEIEQPGAWLARVA